MFGVLVEVAVSPRSVGRLDALAILSSGEGVALTYDADLELGLFLDAEASPRAVQLCGRETSADVRVLSRALSCPVWKSVHLAPAGSGEEDTEATLAEIEEFAAAGTSAVVLDTVIAGAGGELLGGTGRAHDWRAAARIARSSPVPVFLAGGLSPENVRAGIEAVRPSGVDVSSGVESLPGVKDISKMRAFIQAVRATQV